MRAALLLPVVVMACTSRAVFPDGSLDCGVDAPAGVGEAWTEDKRACFIDAVASRERARLVVVLHTEELDPIRWTFVTRDGKIAVTYDNREDAYGSPKETQTRTCTGIAAAGKQFALTGCDTSTGKLSTP